MKRAPKAHVLGEGYIWFAHAGKAEGTSWPDAVQLTKERVPVEPKHVVCLDTCELGNWVRGKLVFIPDPPAKRKR